ncbi:hypothetical protein [Frankia sp. R82]|uniref:hypothetical protein n=1 Tax=Frankia sp. R82 TaxID=2950553 RepID=UPI002043063E|nr:hypothetical protein [Frankia sp. R82]MCM3885421.1 hypothetical protein [Frankia sp. R82]
MTLGLSVFLVAVGATLRYALTWHPGGIDLQVLGLILMVAGIATSVICVLRVVLRTPAREDAPPAPFYDRLVRPPADRTISSGHGPFADGHGPISATPAYRELERQLFDPVIDDGALVTAEDGPTGDGPTGNELTGNELTDDERPTQPGAVDPGWQGSRQPG